MTRALALLVTRDNVEDDLIANQQSEGSLRYKQAILLHLESHRDSVGHERPHQISKAANLRKQ
jgi:hypothetical protein